MKCPYCQRENEPAARFCIHCGKPLPDDAQSGQDVKELQQEIRRLKEILSAANSRLAAVERRLQVSAITMPAPEPVVAPPVAAAVETAAAGEPAPGPEAILPPAPAVTPPPPPPVAVPRPPGEWEQILGGNWLARIGVIMLFIGIAFFVKFAIDVNTQWLSPAARIVMVIVIGIAMIGVGYYWRRRYPTLSQALNGGGIAVLYLCIFAAFAYFRILNFYLAVALLFIISGGSAMLALRSNSMALAIIGILGAFMAPFILGVSGPGRAGVSDGGSGFSILLYIMIVDLAVIALSTCRNWRWFTLLALFGSLASFGLWHGNYHRAASLLLAEGSLTILFLIFVGATMLYHILWRRTPRPFDYTLMFINAAAYFGISHGLMWGHLRVWMGGFSLLMALFYGGLAYIARRRNAASPRLSFFALGIALVFLTIAVPVQFGDKAWLTITWAAEAAVLMWLGIRLRIVHFRYYSYAAFCLTAIRLLAFDTILQLRTFHPVLNERVLAFVFSIAALYLAGYLLWRDTEKGSPGSGQSRYAYPVLLVAGNLLGLWLLGAEIISYRLSHLLYSSLPPVLLLVLTGLLTLYRLIWRRASGTFDLVLIALNAVFYLAISGLLWGDFRAWMGGMYLVCSVFYGALAYFILKSNTRRDVFGLVAAGIALALVTLAIPVQFGDRAWATIVWAVEMVVLVFVFLRLRMPLFAAFGYGVLALMLGRLLFFDSTVSLRAFTLVLNERCLAYVVGIAAICVTTYLLWRERKTLDSWRPTFIALLALANFLMILILSLEAWGYFGSLLVALRTGQYTGPGIQDLRNAQNLSLTIIWAVYAVIALVIGIRLRLRLLRIGALVLLLVTILKVFVYDIWHLQQVYRIIALVGLGVLLLTAGYLYQRYSKVIRGFLVKE